jgi:hypothetical protein
MNGTAICGERVVIVEIHSGHVNLKSGRISDVRADNRNETVVSNDRQCDRPDEACERSFRADDIHLLKEQEAQSLQDPNSAHTWFGTVYQDGVVNRIHRALKRLNQRSANQPA